MKILQVALILLLIIAPPIFVYYWWEYTHPSVSIVFEPDVFITEYFKLVGLILVAITGYFFADKLVLSRIKNELILEIEAYRTLLSEYKEHLESLHAASTQSDDHLDSHDVSTTILRLGTISSALEKRAFNHIPLRSILPSDIPHRLTLLCELETGIREKATSLLSKKVISTLICEVDSLLDHLSKER